MANVNIPDVSLKVGEAVVSEPAGASITSADTGIAPNKPELVLRITCGATAATVTIAAAPHWKALPIAVGANATVYVRVEDTTPYAQSDGSVHITTTQTVTAVALTR